MAYCPNCDAWNNVNNKFCGNCGAKLGEPKNYCPNCDRTFNGGENFCTECGTKLVVKSSYSKPKIPTPSQPKSQPKPSPNILHNKEENLRKISTESYIVNLRKNTNVESKVNYDNSIYISKEENPYLNLTDSELIKKLEIAKNRHADAIKARDISAPRYMKEIKAIEKILNSRHEKPKPEKLKKNNISNKTKNGANYKDTKYKQIERLFLNHPLETEMLLEKVLKQLEIPYYYGDDKYAILTENYGVNEIKKTIKIIEKEIEKKNAVIKTNIRPIKIKRKKKTPKKSPTRSNSTTKYPWKFCKSCGIKVNSKNYSCPRCGGTSFYNHLSEKYKEQNRKNENSVKIKIKEEKDIKQDNRIKSKKLKNKLKDMPFY